MEQLRRSLKEAPVVERGEYQYFVHPVTDGLPQVEPALLREIATEITRRVDCSSVDKILTPEAMGIHHATVLSLETGIPFVVVRKRSYGFNSELAIHQRTGYSEHELYINSIDAGDRVLLLDDVLSTGGTLRAICEALVEIGAEVDVIVVIRRLTDDAVELPVPVTSLVDVDVVDGEVVLCDDHDG